MAWGFRTGSPDEVRTALLVAATEVAEGTYYFMEQLMFFTKAGVLDKPLEKRLKPLVATAELLSYVGHITLKLARLSKLRVDMQVRASCLRGNPSVRHGGG